MKKIIHLTDTHIGYGDMEKRFTVLLSNLVYKKEPPENYVVIITGDIIDDAFNEINFALAKSHIEQIKKIGYDVLVVPGNHDYGNGIYADAKFINIFKKTYFGDTSIKYPKVDIISDIAFIGLDSMAIGLEVFDERSLAQGELGDLQLTELQRILTTETDVIQTKKRVVYLHHHPFDMDFALQLLDSNKLGNILKGKNIDALLFGHRHQGRRWNGKWKIPRVYDGGTSTGKNGGVNPHRIIDLERDARLDYDAEFLSTIP